MREIQVEPEARKPSILLAEDHDDIRSLLATALTSAGCEVIQVANGLGMLDRLHAARRDRHPVDVVVSDLRMPGMSGLRAIALLREASWDGPVVLITAFSDAWARGEAARLRVDVIVAKPFDPTALARLILQLSRPPPSEDLP